MLKILKMFKNKKKQVNKEIKKKPRKRRKMMDVEIPVESEDEFL